MGSRSNIKRTKTVGVYLSKAEVRMVKKQARNHGLSVPAFLRLLIRLDGGREGFDGKLFPSQGKG
jgi:hypothetical protein